MKEMSAPRRGESYDEEAHDDADDGDDEAAMRR